MKFWSIQATINAKYYHSSFGLRYLKANLQEHEKDCEIIEFTNDENPSDIAEALINKKPDFAIKKASNENGDFDLITYGIKIEIENKDQKLRPGMTAFINIEE